jgi:two-component system LytT family sensor kinase
MKFHTFPVRLRPVGNAFLLSTLLALVFFLQDLLGSITMADVSWPVLFYRELVPAYLYAILAFFVFQISQNSPLQRFSWKRLLGIHLLAALIFATIHLFLQSFLTWLLFSSNQTYKQFLIAEHFICPYRLLWRVLVYFIIAAIFYGLDFQRRSTRAEAKVLKLETDLKQAKLDGLKRQLNPDLLFETLRSSAALIATDVERADRLIARLGTFLRLCLDCAGQTGISQDQELKLLEAYCELQTVRENQPIHLSVDIDPAVTEKPIPNLFLFQIVDQLLRRTLKPADHRPRNLQLQIRRMEEILEIQILHFVHVTSEEESERLWKSAKRIQTDLEQVYEGAGNFQVSLTAEHQLKVVLRINLPDKPSEEPLYEIQDGLSYEAEQEFGYEHWRKTLQFPLNGQGMGPRFAITSMTRRTKGFLMFGVWSLLAFYFQQREIHNYEKSMPWMDQLVWLAPWYIWALATPIVLKIAARFPMDRRNWRRSLPIHATATVSIWFLLLVVSSVISWVYGGFKWNFSKVFGETFLYSRLAIHVLIYWSLIIISQMVRYYRKYREEELRGRLLRLRITEAQLQAIRMQLQPHFLFNTLNSISELMHENNHAAVQMLKRLEDFLRLTLSNEAKQEVTLREELEFLSCYLEIQQMRFQDRLKIEMRVDGETLDCLVPSFVCQPILENAVRHGVSQKLDAGLIQIIAERRNSTLRLQIRDNGPGLPDDGSWKEGFGLSNTRAILHQFYGRDHQLKLHNCTDGGVEVTLEMPVHIQQHMNGVA